MLTTNRYKIEYKHNDFQNSGWVYKEISASLRNWKNSRINALICVIDDNIINKIKDFDKKHQGEFDLPEILKLNFKYILFSSYSVFFKCHEDILIESYKRREKQINSGGKAYKIKYNLHKKFLNIKI